MTEYQAISARRMCFQAATILCAYAAARYQKLTLPLSPALSCVTAGVLQGVSTKVRKPLGERSKWNWLLDGFSLGLVAYGTSKLELAKRVKYLTAGVTGGTQVLISNARPHTFSGRVAAIDVKKAGAEEEVNALYDQLVALKDQLTPQDFIRACIALFPKARPFSRRNFIDSAAKKLQDMHRKALERLAGWEKTAAQMHFYELSNTYCIYFTEGTGISKEGLNAEEMAKRQEWLDTTGLWMTQRWAIWELEKKRGLEGRWNALKELMEAPTYRLTVDQKIDLSNEYIKRAYRLEGGIAKGSWCDEACEFKEKFIESLERFEKCQAYMKHAEFYFYIGIKGSYLFDDIFLKIQPTLSESEQSQFQDWMDKTGNAIQADWEEK